ncbi:MAG: hypothetical protein LBR76_08255 [Oscillospiraceae bacterium]|jgi:hypothetical protein|nr:hypothetical protein [Oscillospiraceae bacterium]
MGRYKLTGRGWALIVIACLLLSTGAYALVSSFGGDAPPPNGTTPSNPQLSVVPSPGTPSADTPDPLPDPSPSLEPPPEPPENSPSAEPPADPSLPPELPADPSEAPPEPPVPSPIDIPDPSQPPPDPNPPPDPSPEEIPSPPIEAVSPETAWYAKTDAVMFLFDSAEPSESRERILAALDNLIPPPGDLVGYIVVVEAYVSEDETTEGLAQQRADFVAEILQHDLGIPAAQIRVQAGESADGDEAWRQRADVYFLYVGNK